MIDHLIFLLTPILKLHLKLLVTESTVLLIAMNLYGATILHLQYCHSQGRYFENVPIGSYWIFPVKFRNIFIVTGNDVNGKNYRGATQILTFSDYSLEKVKLGATLIDRDADSFYGRIVAFGLI